MTIVSRCISTPPRHVASWLRCRAAALWADSAHHPGVLVVERIFSNERGNYSPCSREQAAQEGKKGLANKVFMVTHAMKQTSKDKMIKIAQKIFAWIYATRPLAHVLTFSGPNSRRRCCP